MASALLLVISMLALGYGLARLGIFAREASDAFHRFVIYLCLPATIWKLVPSLQFESGLWLAVCVPWLLLLLMAAAVPVLSRAFGWERPVCGALLLCVTIGNTSFLGFPMLSALLGEQSLRYAVLYDQLGSFLALSTYGLFVAARYGGGETPTLKQTLLRVVRFPPFIALVLAFTPLPRAEVLQPLWARLSDALVPLAMFAVGLRIEFKPPRPRSALFTGLALKMLLMPALALLIAQLCGAPRELLNVVVLEAGMPASITAGAIAMLAGLAPELAAALVGYGVLLALVTLPLMAAAIGAHP